MTHNLDETAPCNLPVKEMPNIMTGHFVKLISKLLTKAAILLKKGSNGKSLDSSKLTENTIFFQSFKNFERLY